MRVTQVTDVLFAHRLVDGSDGASGMSEQDLELVRKVVHGDGPAYLRFQIQIRKAFDQIWARLHSRLRDAAAHRSDLAQSLELHLLKDDYRVLRTFRGDARLTTWLYVVAHRHAARQIHALRLRHQREGTPLQGDRVDETTDPETRAIRGSEALRLRQAMAKLTSDERVLLAMFYEQELDSSQIAKVLHMSAAGVRMKKKRLLAKLEAELGQN